ncbi:MAG: DNA-processing protein DprA [Patescibacteria group bacterium]|jgi:DNA processing protein
MRTTLATSPASPPPPSQTERAHWVAFSHCAPIGPKQFSRLISSFPSLETAWNASDEELRSIGITDKAIEARTKNLETFPDPVKLLENITDAGIDVVTIRDDQYPRLLKEIPDHPYVLYTRGTLTDMRTTLGIVGTRRATSYGIEVARRFAQELAGAGVGIISGLALGIDAASHAAAVEAQGYTIAVLGSGVDDIYPRTNQGLADSIIANNGCILSEFPPGTFPQKQHFPIRNRIIAGLSKGVLVIEGGQDSGSLITARLALEYNRDVMAVPGDIFRDMSAGPNRLIQMGATLVTRPHDVMETLGEGNAENIHRVDNPGMISNNQLHTQTTAEERALLDLLAHAPRHVDELIHLSALSPAVVSAALTTMELKGAIRNIGGMNYVRH